MPRAIEIAQTRQTPFTAGLLMAVMDSHPLFSAFDFRTVGGYEFLSLALKSRPNPANFADYGEGFTHTDARFEVRNFSCSLVGGIIKAECITEERWNRDNAALDWEWFDIQTEEKFFESILALEMQIIRGRLLDPKGFPGAKELTPFEAGNVMGITDTAASFKFARAVINAGGTQNGEASSVYSFIFGEKECQGVIGGGDTSGEFLRLGETERQFLAPDPDEPEKLSEHKVAQMAGHIGMSVAGFNKQAEGQEVPVQYALRRLANVTTQDGATLNDQKMDKLRRSHGTGKRPSLFAMSERSGEQLAASRQPVQIYNMGSGDAATNQANLYPDPPSDWRDIPIVYPGPDVIADDEAIEV